MPRIRVLFWNVQTFGQQAAYRTLAGPQCNLLAEAALNMQADVILIQEVMQAAYNLGYLTALQAALNRLPRPFNNWYFELVKGSVRMSGGTAPFATAADLNWDAAHHEGYAVFWNQNISKFKMTPAPPVQQPFSGPVANSQSETVRMQGMALGTAVAGFNVPFGGITAAANATYIVPAGTTGYGVDTQVPAGTVLPVNTHIGFDGVTLNSLVNGVRPIVIPGSYTLADAVTLPANTTLVPEHGISLVMFGLVGGNNTKCGNIQKSITPFKPNGGIDQWDWLYFPTGAGNASAGPGCRRPAFVTLDVNRAPPNTAAANRLVPVIVYHAPSVPPASTCGMQRAAYSQQMYWAYDWGTNTWVTNDNTLIGGDFNVVLPDKAQYSYDAYTRTFVNGGANCNIAIANPAIPPPPNTRADNPLNKSRVAFDNFGTQIYGAALDTFKNLAIDNAFYRGFVAQAPTAALYDLLVATTGGSVADPAIPGASMFSLLTIPNLNTAWTAMQGGHLPPVVPDLVDVARTVQDLTAGVIGPSGSAGNSTPARRAAEIVNLCISDHVPVVVEVAL